MDIKLPKLGEGAESGTVAGILVKVGDTVAEGQTIIELENEKAVAPIPASAAGRVTALRVKQGDKISVGHVILSLDGPAAATPPASPERPSKPVPAEPTPPPETPEPAPTPETAESPEPLLEPAPAAGPAPAAPPSIRRLARDLGLDLNRIRGSERGGRITLADVRAYVKRLQQLAFRTPAAKAAPAPTPSAPPAERVDFSKWGPVTRQPMSILRQTISRRMAESWTSIPHVTQFDEADVTRVNALRKQYAPAYEKAGTKLTLTSFVLKAAAETLQKHPRFNSSLDETSQELVLKEYCHLGLAVDTDHGLIVPVIRDADKKDLVQLSKDVSTLADKARQRTLTLDELRGGTFTLSNQGGIGGAHFTPIINKPEVAILGLGRGVPKAAVRNGNIEPRWLMPLGLSYDHRVIDGASAARFVVDFVAALENFPEETVKAPLE